MQESRGYLVEDMALIRNLVNQIENAAIDCYITHPEDIGRIQKCLTEVLGCIQGREAFLAAGCGGDEDCPPGWICADGYCTPKTRRS